MKNKIVFACDVGIGTSVMGATKFRNRIQAVRPDINVIHTSIDDVPSDADIVICQTMFVERAAKSAPQARIVMVNNFLSDPNLDALCDQLTKKKQVEPAENAVESRKAATNRVLIREGIKVGQKAATKEEAIRAAGELLCTLGYVDASYIDAMQVREQLVTTYIGMGVAMPHGTAQAKSMVKKSGIVILQYPDGVPFGDEKARLVFGIAGAGEEHLDLMSRICMIFEDEDMLEKLKSTAEIDFILSRMKEPI